MEVIHKIASYPPPYILSNDDEFRWGATTDGVFNTKSAYLVQLNATTNTNIVEFKYIWKWKGNECICTFLWKLAHEALLTNVERTKRTMTTIATCPVCLSDNETLFHRFRDCPSSLAIWNAISVQNRNSFFNNNNWQDWLKANLKRNLHAGAGSWSTTFGVTLDLLWRNRNDLIFSQKVNSTQSSFIRIKNQVDWIEICLLRNSTLQPQLLFNDDEQDDRWKPPPSGYYQLNCDGSMTNFCRSAGCGGIL